MSTFEKFGFTFYSIMDSSDDVLNKFFQEVTRLELIGWLSWNDRNGVYRDEQSLLEFQNIMSRDEGVEIMKRQIMDGK